MIIMAGSMAARTWQQAESYGAGAIAKSLHVIFKIQAEREIQTVRQTDWA